MVATLHELLERGAGQAPAILAPGRPGLTHAQLRHLCSGTARALAEAGVGRADPVAIVLPNGPEMASCFLAVAAAAASAPLNPAYKEEEFDFYLADLGARAMIVAADETGPAVAIARRHGATILRLQLAEGAPAGAFSLAVDGDARPPATPGLARPDDTALVLHTSGTTSRPKMVPLTQGNLVASAGHIAASLALGSADRCLNIMPLFHIHGLIAAVLSSVGAGGSVFCTPGFNALRFFAWLEEARATWYTAVPTMHQAILARAGRHQETSNRAGLRFIRSSSSSLPAQVMGELEAAFSCPVIESYGMTEAAHQMASNPLPPAARKPGSVGIAAGPQVRIADDANAFLPAGGVGEVVISGPDVTPGYVANPAANAAAFFAAEGAHWFRTGDQGMLDEEGYLRLTGRLKEIINRGGEKVSPLEVDAVLMDHPAIQQVVTFAMRHAKLGEEVAAAVVLREGHAVDEQAIREFAATRLADFKVPRRVVVLPEIPKGATGKLQRIGLAAKLGLG